MDNLIDFSCSPLWQDYYYERGMTPIPSHDGLTKSYRTVQEDLRRLKIERKKLQLSDEEWFGEELNKRFVQRLFDQKERRIEELQQEIRTLRAQIPQQQTTRHDEILGLE